MLSGCQASENAAVIDDKDENVIQDCETEYVAECLRQKRIWMETEPMSEAFLYQEESGLFYLESYRALVD